MRYSITIFILSMSMLLHADVEQEQLTSDRFTVNDTTDSSSTSSSSSSAKDISTQLPVKEELLQQETPQFSYTRSFMKMLISLLGMILLLWIGIRFLKRIGQGHFRGFKNNQIKIIEKKPLSPKSVLYLVDVNGKRMIIAESQWEVRLMTSLDDLEKLS